jgi:hypothetical protein
VIEEDDWRLRKQMEYLYETELKKMNYERYSVTWDHDHCEFCWKKLMYPSDIGYCTLDRHRWICEECFEDFKGMFKWKVISKA